MSCITPIVAHTADRAGGEIGVPGTIDPWVFLMSHILQMRIYITDICHYKDLGSGINHHHLHPLPLFGSGNWRANVSRRCGGVRAKVRGRRRHLRFALTLRPTGVFR